MPSPGGAGRFYDGTAVHRVVRDFVIQTGLLSTRIPPIPEFRQADLVRRLKAEFNDTPHVKGILSWKTYNDLLMTFGQNLCVPASPWCSRCPVKRHCAKAGLKRSR